MVFSEYGEVRNDVGWGDVTGENEEWCFERVGGGGDGL